jgi:protein-disulfide isomerase
MILTKYINPGRVRFVLRVIAADPLSLRGAAMALCVRRQYYFAFVDLLLRTQSNWDRPELAEAGLTRAAYTGGVIGNHAGPCSTDPLTIAALEKASKDLETRYKAAALPMLVINGKTYDGKADGPKLYRAIEAAESSRLAK